MNKRYRTDGDYRAGWDAYNADQPRVVSNGSSWTDGWDAAKADHMGLRIGSGR